MHVGELSVHSEMQNLLATLLAAGAIRLPGLRVGRAGPAQMVAEPAINAPPPTLAPPAKKRLNVRIDDTWYDLTNWRAAHPAGTHWIDAYDGADATEVMYAFHSDRAMSMMQRLPKSKAPPTDVAPPAASSYAFRALREKLVADGWWRVSPLMEARKLLPWFSFTALGAVLARRSGLAAALGAIACLAIGNTLSGWLSHDFVHGRSRWAWTMRGFGELVGGMSTTWWSMKHNMHHALTNEVGYDEDVALEPALYLWRPDPKNDSPLRKYQHWYWPLPFSILFLYWRFDSWKYALQHKEWGQAARLAAHYAVYFALFPLKTFFFAIWLSGLLTATVVTVTHQSEEMFLGDSLRKYDFVEAQFRSTRDAKMSNWFSSILWGGARRDAASALPRTPSSHTHASPIPQGWSGSSSTTSSRRCRATATRSSRPSSRPSPTRTTSTTASRASGRSSSRMSTCCRRCRRPSRSRATPTRRRSSSRSDVSHLASTGKRCVFEGTAGRRRRDKFTMHLDSREIALTSCPIFRDHLPSCVPSI